VFNHALLEKRLWRYIHEREALWRVVVDSKNMAVLRVGGILEGQEDYLKEHPWKP
jgi:hypothetical protein